MFYMNELPEALKILLEHAWNWNIHDFAKAIGKEWDDEWTQKNFCRFQDIARLVHQMPPWILEVACDPSVKPK